MPISAGYYIIFDMSNYRYQLPSMSVLSAFECAARHNSFSRAAEELHTSQPAVSRHVAGLEAFLGVKLFNRSRGRVTLTTEGQRLYHSVVSGLEEMAAAVRDIRVQRKSISIACTYSVSHLWLMPRHDRLQAALGEDVEIVTVSSEYEYHERLQEEGIDICLTFAGDSINANDKRLVFSEEIFTVCSPQFAREHKSVLSEQGDAAVASLPLLDLGQKNYGWATWETWFQSKNLASPDAENMRRFGNYVYLLEAASNGQGVAIGWAGMVDEYVKQGRLISLQDEPTKTGGGCYVLVNPMSQNRNVAEQAVACLCM